MPHCMVKGLLKDHKTSFDSTWEGYLQGEGDALHEVMIPMVHKMAQEVGLVIDYLITRPGLMVLASQSMVFLSLD